MPRSDVTRFLELLFLGLLACMGFSAEQQRLSRMRESMAGRADGTRGALTRFTQPLTGSYYFVPSVESLRQLR